MVTRLSTKGQVTIPQTIREELGIGPGSAVAMELIDGVMVLRPCAEHEAPPSPPRAWIERLRGSATVGLTTEEIMAMTRGED